MKKTWVALAVLGAFATVAQAQSSVTLYGIVDVNVQYFDPKPSGADSVTRIDSGHQSGSRWGMRGSEDLGGGLKGVFTLEGGYSPDTGTIGQSTATTTRLFGRQAWAGLQGGFGTIVLGRVALLSSGTGSFDMFGSVDPFGTGFGGLNLAFNSASALRVDNAILWKSNNMGGFQVGLNHSRNISGSETAPNSANAYQTGGAASFGAGPFFGAVTYDVINNPAPGADDQKHLQVGATFDLGVVKLHAAYAKEDNQFGNSVVGTTNGADSSNYMAGVSAPLGGGSLMASYNNRNGKLQGTYEADLVRWGIAYSYPLSRRTNLYASYADNNGKKSLDNNPSYDFRQFTLGMRHLF